MNNHETKAHERQQKRRSGFQRASEFMPSPDILEGYDYVVQGSAARILAMFEAEQKHRHAWETAALKIHTFSTILGQILGFVIAMAIFLSAGAIGISGNSAAATFIWVFGLAIVAMAGMVWVYAKGMGQRPLFARPAMRTHFRPEKNLDAASKGVYDERRGRNG